MVERREADSRVAVGNAVSGRVIILERVRADGGVSRGRNIGRKCGYAKSVVGESVNVIIERKGADSIVEGAAVVKDERVSSTGHIQRAAGVEQQRSGANCGIGIPRVEHKRSSANTGIVAASRKAFERKPTKCCIESAGGAAKKGVLPFCGVAPGIAAVRRRLDRLRCWQRRKAGKHEDDMK